MPAARSSGTGTACTRSRASAARRSRSSWDAVAGLGQDGHQPLPDARPADGVEIGLAGDDEPGGTGRPPAVSSPRLAPLPPTEPVSCQPDVFEPPNFLHVSYLRNCAWHAPPASIVPDHRRLPIGSNVPVCAAVRLCDTESMQTITFEEVVRADRCPGRARAADRDLGQLRHALHAGRGAHAGPRDAAACFQLNAQYDFAATSRLHLRDAVRRARACATTRCSTTCRCGSRSSRGSSTRCGRPDAVLLHTSLPRGRQGLTRD